MLAGKPSFTSDLIKAIIAGLLISSAFSCKVPVVVKNYQHNKPFVYETNINVIGNFTNEEKQDFTSRIKSQLDDSVKSRTIDKVIYKVMKTPPVYDPANADKSVLFIKSLMVSLGYFNDSTKYSAKIDTESVKHGQYRTTVTFDVKPGKLVRLDSVWYSIKNPELQNITQNNLRETYLKKGDAFAKGTIGAELDRLVELYRNNGYLRFTRDELVGLWDTLDVSLLQPSLDPFEQLQVLQKLKERREKPTANLEIRLRPGYDSTRLVKYFVGKVNIYPDYTPDIAGRISDSVNVATEMNVIQFRNKFKPKIFPVNVYLKHGTLYSQSRYQRTINRFNSLGVWRLINAEQKPRPGQDTVDFDIKLTPSAKYLFTANLEASQNQSVVSGNLFGLGVILGIQNRNFAKAANQSNTNFRYGVEFGSKFIQTQQVSFGHTIYFPRPIPTFKKLIPERFRDNIRTLFSFNAANTERRELYNLTTINGAWGYEFQRNLPRRNRSYNITIRIPNIEYSYLKKRDSLRTLISNNPILKNIFTDGLISSTSGGINYNTGKKNSQNIYSANIEESGLVAGLIPSDFLDTQLYRYIKLNAEFTRLTKFRKSSLVFHAFAGVGYELNSTVNPEKKNNLPFFKEYYAGGPNSMRGWRLRRLGPGSAIKSFSENPERYGDVQLEFNIEYRFLLATVSGIRLETVLFTDIGNIWFLKKNAGSPEEVFKLGRLGKDLAVDAGTGLRIDFTYFLIRLDYAYKAKDPSPDLSNAASQNKWFYNLKPFGGQLQIGINYPFKL